MIALSLRHCVILSFRHCVVVGSLRRHCVIAFSLRHFFHCVSLSLRCHCVTAVFASFVITLSLRHCVITSLRCHCAIASFCHCVVIASFCHCSDWLKRAKTKGTTQVASPGGQKRSPETVARTCGHGARPFRLPFAQHPYRPGGATRCRWPIKIPKLW